MKRNSTLPSPGLPLALFAAFGLAPSAHAAAAETDWQYRASVYAFLPEITGELRVDVPAGGRIDVDADELMKNLKFAAMGSFEAQKGRWGFFVDVVHMNIGDSIADSTALAHGTLPLPPGVTADASLDVNATAFTVAANYRAISTKSSQFDVFGGARLLDAEGELEWRFETPMGPLPPPMGQGSGSAGKQGWDGIVGVKGRHSFGERQQWFVPYYIDAGAGASDFTWQAAAGIGYSARWGETFLVWRHLAYEFGEDRAIENISFSGPAIGVAFHW
ncbi:hypothetical protein [Arenimonas sp.]|uniref:hypothetical protein n=1 Tax=Arenimonas sp. TaxID=1872635 RepID=UPI0039E23AF1